MKIRPMKSLQIMKLFWKLQNVFGVLNYRFSEVFHPAEHLSVYEVSVLFKGKLVFRQCIPKHTNASA
jgi:hypothetical protein